METFDDNVLEGVVEHPTMEVRFFDSFQNMIDYISICKPQSFKCEQGFLPDESMIFRVIMTRTRIEQQED